MVSAIATTLPVSSIAPTRGSYPLHVQRFSVPESPVRRSDDIRSTDATDSVLADTVALSGIPALTDVQQAYTPPPGFGLGAGGEPDSPRAPAEEAADTLTGAREEAAADTGEAEESEESEPGEKINAQGQPLSEEEQKQLDNLESRDREVRQHEQAHKAAGGSLAGAISYSYQRGPDGRSYAVGGEVAIDVSPESEPSATISKMQRVRAAALAPANPSGQDRQVAAQASSQEMQARKELSQERVEEGNSSGNEKDEDGQNDGSNTVGAVGPASLTAASAAPNAASGRLDAPSQTAESIAGSLNRSRARIDVFA